MRIRALVLGGFVALASSACAGQDAVSEEALGEVSEAAAVTKIAATEGALTLTFDTLGTFQDRANGRALILTATANRYLSNVFTFVPDDAFGTARIISERRLEIELPVGHELNTVLSGLPLFLTVQTFTGTPNSYTARVDIGPRFYDFRGSNEIWIDEVVKPVYGAAGLPNPLVYRGHADVTGTNLTVTAPDGAPVMQLLGGGEYNMNWTYTAVHQAVDPHTVPLTFTAQLPSGATAQKTARLVTRVTGLALTSGDPYEVWATPGCQANVLACVNGMPAGTTDFGWCGSYREVSRCLNATTCDVLPTEPFSLSPLDTSSLEPARDAWNDGSNGGAWHGIDTIRGFDTPECPEEPITIAQVVAEVEELGQQQQQQGGWYSETYTDRAGLSQSMFFNTYYGNGVDLLAAVDTYAGGGPIQAWIAWEETSCHNCHSWRDRAILYYPDSGIVVVVDGYHGYDS
ncbi:hypothetical protein [Chondromyces apiculatus]|uniref:Lipoprotein n=1 Tax=Chondromyces apiculatus DSM 436 TaxID=1192034 RepID=A0A017T2L3_9BACT|nr:hypothetical protein [Chondromyces apiculatus]EYF03237.1 Hypothetical protein CAP_5741 [Chondromyces apiculatus DSM 436]